MTKIMLVEDDNGLREIYSIRLTAEGYTVVSAGDGEEALAMAVRERPDLIISDVMMPKISGFDMLDILRSTPETKDIKVIMMTALSSEDQRTRGERLGADRYLVKSQVGIEDVVNAVHEVLHDRDGNGMITPEAANSQGNLAEQEQTPGLAEPLAPLASTGPVQVGVAEQLEVEPMNLAMTPEQVQASEQITVQPDLSAEAPTVVPEQPPVLNIPRDEA